MIPAMTRWNRIAPIFPVHDVEVALGFYEKLGFSVRRYEDAGVYGFATRGDIELHLGLSPSTDGHPNSAYLFVDDADDLAEQWRSAGIEVHGPEDTDWRKHEGAVRDPDGNVIRFGSPMRD